MLVSAGTRQAAAAADSGFSRQQTIQATPTALQQRYMHMYGLIRYMYMYHVVGGDLTERDSHDEPRGM